MKFYKNLSASLWKLRILVCGEHKSQKHRAKKEETKFTDSSIKWSSVPSQRLFSSVQLAGISDRDIQLMDITALHSLWRKTPCTQAHWCLAKTFIQSPSWMNLLQFILKYLKILMDNSKTCNYNTMHWLPKHIYPQGLILPIHIMQ